MKTTSMGYEMNKYEMIECDNSYRIKALRDVGVFIKKGDLGGLIENENNLDQDGDSWIYKNASVQGTSRVLGDAWVSGYARVSGNAVISGKAVVSGNAIVADNAVISDTAWVTDSAHILGNAEITGDAQVLGDARVSGCASVCEYARVFGSAIVSDFARISGNAWVSGGARVCEYARVLGNARVSGDAVISGSAIVSDSAEVKGNAHVHGNAEVKGNARISGDAHIAEEIIVKKGEYVEDLTCNRNYLSLLRNEFSVSPVNDTVILYKKVNSTSDEGVYTSCFDPDFIYEVGKTAIAEKVEGRMISCAAGLHVSTPEYWHVGDTLIAVEINVKDIITIQDGKVRVSKLKVITVV